MDYGFNLLSGNYKTTYKLQDGPNPENSTVTTPYYTDHFSDRWLNDQLRITTAGSSGVDILDRAKPQFGPGVCGRTEDTFDDAEGAFIANKSGPVRAIRSYIGANSGPLTQREHIFYERREDIRTYLRVHAIPGVMDYFDYAPAASGMTYKNNAQHRRRAGRRRARRRRHARARSRGRPWTAARAASRSCTRTRPTSPASRAAPTTSTTSTPGSGAETQCTGTRRPTATAGRGSRRPSRTPIRAPPRFNSLLATRTLYFEDAGKANGAARSARGGRADQRHRHELPVGPVRRRRWRARRPRP